MRPQVFVVAALAASGAQASWFSSKPEYQSWDEAQLKAWLQSKNINTPDSYNTAQLQDLVKSNWDTASAWTADQYAKAQKVFVDVKDDSFAAWDESRLREFLLDQGVVEPKGTREQLAVLARQKYHAYSAYASSLSSSISTAASTAVYGDATYQASKSATSVYSHATDSAGSAYNHATDSAGSAYHHVTDSAGSAASVASATASSAYTEASSTASSVIAQASAEVARQLDDSKDYVYSSWEDSRLRQFLQDKGLVEPKVETTRVQLLRKMQGAYLSATEPAYHAWADSYIRHWLLAHGMISSNDPSTDTAEFRQALADNLSRDSLSAKMSQYYYGTKDYVFSTWSDSELHNWLVSHGVVKSDARIQRDKLVRLVQDNYSQAEDTVWGAWTDSQMREWLIENGYLRTDAQKTRDELIKLMNQKYDNAANKSASYLVWPDARLRAYLRNRGLSESALPTSRPGLLQETRIRWVQTQTQAESAYHRVLSLVNGGLAAAEAKIGELLSLLSGSADRATAETRATYEDGKAYAHEKVGAARGAAHDAAWEAKAAGYDASAGWQDAKGTARSAAAQVSGAARATAEGLKGKAASATAEAEKATARVKHEL